MRLTGMRGGPPAFVLGLALVVLAAADVQAAGGIEDHQFDSAALGRPVDFRIYLPEVLADGRRRLDGPLPVLFLLHGLGGNHRDWTIMGKATETLDRLIAAGTIRPLVVVMPDADNSWYVNSPPEDGAGPYAAAIGVELPAAVAARWPIRADRFGRAVAGLSMGGFGALRFAFEAPEAWAAVAAFSPAIFPLIDNPGELSETQIGFYKGVFGTPLDLVRWNRDNPFARLDRVGRADPPPAIWLMVGDHDGFRLDRGTVALHFALEDVGVKSELRVVDGDHHWRIWAEGLDPALRFIDGAFREPDPR